MIGPARGLSADGDIVYRMVDIGRINTQRIERQPDPRGIANVRDKPGRDEQANAPRNFRDAGQEDDLAGKGNPVRRDGQKPAGALNMGDARDDIDGDQQQPEKPAREGVLRGFRQPSSPQAGGGAGTGLLRSNSTRKNRPVVESGADEGAGGRRSS